MLSGYVRSLFHNPNQILNTYLDKGMTVADIGCGMGFFSVPMARMVGPQDKVIAVDIQQKMLTGMMQNALKEKVQKQIHHSDQGSQFTSKEFTEFCKANGVTQNSPIRKEKMRFMRESLKFITSTTVFPDIV